jgi:hypothetical protein
MNSRLGKRLQTLPKSDELIRWIHQVDDVSLRSIPMCDTGQKQLQTPPAREMPLQDWVLGTGGKKSKPFVMSLIFSAFQLFQRFNSFQYFNAEKG